MGQYASHPPHTYTQTSPPDHTTRVHTIAHSIARSNSYTRGESTFQYMGNYRSNPGSPSSRWRGVLFPEKAKIKACGITVMCFGLFCTNAR